MLTAAGIGGAQAESVAAFVNGEPITALDVDQRSKLDEVSSPTHKVPSRQEVLDELINEKLKIREGRRWGVDASDSEVEQAFASTGQRMVHQNAEQFAQTLIKAGVNPTTFKSRLRAELIWQPLVRGRYSSSLEIYDKDILQEMINKKPEGSEVTESLTTHRAHPVHRFSSLRHAARSFDDRKREAEGLRNRFRSCDMAHVRARPARWWFRRSSAAPPMSRPIRAVLNPVCQLTTRVTSSASMFAVCAKDVKADNSGKRQARESLFNENRAVSKNICGTCGAPP